jgi:hypothetical protein
MKESKGNTVKFRLDGQLPAGLQPLKTDDRPIIDYSDAPELSDAWFEQASRGGQLHLKKQVSMRIDDDILDFFKSEGNRYQTRMHAVLRAYVDVHKGK